MVYMGSQKSSADHFLGVVFNEETHGDLCFGSFCRRYTVIERGHAFRATPRTRSARTLTTVWCSGRTVLP